MKAEIEISFKESERSPAEVVRRLLEEMKTECQASIDREKSHIADMQAIAPGWGGDSDDYIEMAEDQMKEILALLAYIEKMYKEEYCIKAWRPESFEHDKELDLVVTTMNEWCDILAEKLGDLEEDLKRNSHTLDSGVYAEIQRRLIALQNYLQQVEWHT
jgi:hypothetical protein